MDIDIRQAVLLNISESTQEQLEETITDAIDQREEKTLPGLGVLFELIWEHSGEMEKQEMIDALDKGIQQIRN